MTTQVKPVQPPQVARPPLPRAIRACVPAHLDRGGCPSSHLALVCEASGKERDSPVLVVTPVLEVVVGGGKTIPETLSTNLVSSYTLSAVLHTGQIVRVCRYSHVRQSFHCIVITFVLLPVGALADR